jgi:YjjG family noncanonical pyrimidine nucleotidase
MSVTAAPAIPPRYEWVLFDADGTLFDYDRAESAALAKAFEAHKQRFKPEYVPAYRAINQALWRQLERGHITPDLLKVRRFELLLENIGIRDLAEDFSKVYLDCLARCSELMEGAGELLQLLNGRCKSAIATNGLSRVQRGRVSASPLNGLVTELIISEDIGYAKPAPEFFREAFRRIGEPPRSQVLMVGDNWASDIVGAVNYGLDACWFNPAGQGAPGTGAATYMVRSLAEISKIIFPLPLRS